MRRTFAKFSAVLVAGVVVGSTAGVMLAAPASATPSCGSTCWVSPAGSDSNTGTSGSPLLTIQAGINAVDPGGTVFVRPGSYNETAPGVTPISIPGTYTFGLYLGKNNITVQGVDHLDAPITNPGNVDIPTVTTNSTADFGPDGVFVEGDGDTIAGLSIGANTPGCNKTIEVVGDAFTFKDGVVNDPCGGDIYIDDFRYNTGTDTPHVNSYTITGNDFGPGNTIDIGNGAGHGTPASTRLITNNTFEGGGSFGGTDGNGYYPSISFNGSGSGIAWFLYPVGGATITGNTFTPHDQYIRARGTYDTATFDWNSYFANNTFPAAAMTTTPTNDVQTYAYSFNASGYGCPGNTCTWNTVRRINGTLQTAHGAGCDGADCHGDVDNAQPGDTVQVQGTFNESVNLIQAVSLQGFGDTAYLNSPTGPGVSVNAPGPLTISDLHFTGPVPSVNVASTSVPPTVYRNALVSLVNQATAPVNATCNWWGQNTGPLVGQTTGAVNAAFWLTAAAPLATAPCNQLGVPGAPVIGVAVAGGVGSAVVSFSPPGSDGGSAVTGYTATCFSLDGEATVSASGGGSPITVSGLVAGTPYQCSVTATNVIGTGPPSGLSGVFGLPGAQHCTTVPSAPLALSNAPGNGSAVVSWAPPVTGGECLAGYVVTPYLGTVAQLSVLIPGHGTTTVVSGLTNGLTYTFTVTAENGLVEGPPSVMSSSVTVGAPAAVTVAHVSRVAKGVVKVGFGAPRNNGSPITKYTATCSSSNGGVTRSKSARTGPVTVSGLTPGKSYTCTVKATNARGTGPSSHPSTTIRA